MTTSREDLDRFTNSLSAELGLDTVALLSAEEDERQFIGADVLATYAVYLFGIFAAAFLASLKAQLEAKAKEEGKKLAELLVNRVTGAIAKLKKPTQASKEDRQQVLSTVDEALRDAAACPDAAAALRVAERAGAAQIAAELKAKGMDAAAAQEKAENLMKTIVSRMAAA